MHLKTKFLVCSAALMVVSIIAQQPEVPHVSSITPPPIPGVVPHLRRHPNNLMDLYVPPGKTAEMLRIGNMQVEELLDRVRTNRYNLYLIEFSDAPPVPLSIERVTPAEAEVLRTYREGQPKHP